MQNNGHKSGKTSDQVRQSLVDGLFRQIEGQVERTNRAQAHFLELRRTGLGQMAQIIAHELPGGELVQTSGKKALMDSRQLDAFGRGTLTDCLGPSYSIYNGRRTPRIPNGDLKLMSRVVELQGEPRNFNLPAHVVTEYDLPVDAWFLRENAYPTTPYSVFMEMALQPCGILSAWMGTMLQAPEVDFYFRNLDGWAEMTNEIDLRGKTITARADLLSSLSTGDTIIQKFRFELSYAGAALYRGESSFGYFSPQAMSKQLGLDGGQQTRPAIDDRSLRMVDIQDFMTPAIEKPYLRLPAGQLQFLNQAAVQLDGGRYGGGYVYASKDINPTDWFYDCHFYQDPVMPGSLGIEAILQALQAYAIEAGLGQQFRSARFGLPADQKMLWKYRGQITPVHKKMELEAHISGIERQADQVVVRADASLWVDHIRIYEVKQASVSLLEG